MIQRIQTIYLFLAGILPAITVFCPVILFSDGTKSFKMSSVGYEAAMFPELSGQLPWIMGVFAILSVVMAYVALMGYKNRVAQMRKTLICGLFNVLWYFALGYYAITMSSTMNMSTYAAMPCFLPLLSIILVVLAYRAIRKDEEKVRAADRIR